MKPTISQSTISKPGTKPAGLRIGSSALASYPLFSNRRRIRCLAFKPGNAEHDSQAARQSPTDMGADMGAGFPMERTEGQVSTMRLPKPRLRQATSKGQVKGAPQRQVSPASTSRDAADAGILDGLIPSQVKLPRSASQMLGRNPDLAQRGGYFSRTIGPRSRRGDRQAPDDSTDGATADAADLLSVAATPDQRGRPPLEVPIQAATLGPPSRRSPLSCLQGIPPTSMESANQAATSTHDAALEEPRSTAQRQRAVSSWLPTTSDVEAAAGRSLFKEAEEPYRGSSPAQPVAQRPHTAPSRSSASVDVTARSTSGLSRKAAAAGSTSPVDSPSHDDSALDAVEAGEFGASAFRARSMPTTSSSTAAAAAAASEGRTKDQASRTTGLASNHIQSHPLTSDRNQWYEQALPQAAHSSSPWGAHEIVASRQAGLPPPGTLHQRPSAPQPAGPRRVSSFTADLERCTSPGGLILMLKYGLVPPPGSDRGPDRDSAAGKRSLTPAQVEQVVVALAGMLRGQKPRETAKWREVGPRVAGFLGAHWQRLRSSPAGTHRISGRPSDAAGTLAKGSGAAACRAVDLLEAVSVVGPSFYSSDLIESLLAAVEDYPAALTASRSSSPESADQDLQLAISLLVRALCACARCGHLIRRSALTRISCTLLAHLTLVSSPAVCVGMLWAMGRYRLRVQELDEAATVAIAGALARLDGAWAMHAARLKAAAAAGQRKRGGLASLLPASASGRSLQTQGPDRVTRLGLVEATQLATALADLELQPDGPWLDRWLSDLIPHLTEQPAAAAQLATSAGLKQASLFLVAVSRLGYQPGEVWVRSMAERLTPMLVGGSSDATAGRTHTLASGSTALDQQRSGTSDLSSVEDQVEAAEAADLAVAVAATLEALALMEARPPDAFCRRAVAAVVRDGALLTGGCFLPTRVMAALSRLLPQPGRWVRANVFLLEQLVLAASAHLRTASAAELTGLVGAVTALRFYPGDQFLRWHDGSCTKLGKAFPDKKLCEVREAYISLGYRPERTLYERMEAAKIRERRLYSAQQLRQSDALVAIVKAEHEVRQDGARRKKKRLSLQASHAR